MSEEFDNWQSAEQRQICFERTEAGAVEWDKERGRIAAEANAARSEAAQRRPRNEDGTLASDRTSSAATGPHSDKGRETRATLAGTNRGAVQRVAKMRRLAQELGQHAVIDAVASGEVKAFAALKSLEEQKRKADLERPATAALPPGLHHGDFRRLSDDIADNSVELIFTDPPYDRESIPLFEDAAKMAARILRPGGSLITYCGQTQLPEALALCAKHLRYWWCAAALDENSNQRMNRYGIICQWKPLLWFVKGSRGDVQTFVKDVVGGAKEKGSHAWQQSQAQAEHWISALTSPSGLVVDFFSGSGTTAAAAQKLGRPWIGFEIDAQAVEGAANRLRA